ncbi:glycoside hydrolase family 43 protein [Neolewinella litorea]|uniref:glycoside hydrolase family 43 protein n=1 Tax=Neolewinella litorea TaxID=2562452 RepID=UPI001B3B552B|nr:glycoside hydrolase family 43 protein [Neolewinella litorea]
MRISLFSLSLLFILFGCQTAAPTTNGDEPATSGNPIFPGWYADPEAVVFDDEYWIFPTYSADYTDQLHLDAFSSPDLVTWTKHERILDTTIVPWVRQALWAPAAIEKDGQYYLFFAGNDVQRPSRPGWDPDNDINHHGGIGVAVADHPAGPYRDHVGGPLLDTFYHDAQPIDQFVYRDEDGTHYFYYGGWGHCNIGRLNADFTGFLPWDDGQLFHEITPENYVEGPFLFRRKGIYYLMWSEGGWTNATYKVAYGMADSPLGPFPRQGTILEADSTIATGAGHNSAIRVPDTDDWYMVYHRRPIPNEDRDHRVTCIDRIYFNEDGTIRPVKMTFTGVEARPLANDR